MEESSAEVKLIRVLQSMLLSLGGREEQSQSFGGVVDGCSLVPEEHHQDAHDVDGGTSGDVEHPSEALP